MAQRVIKQNAAARDAYRAAHESLLKSVCLSKPRLMSSPDFCGFLVSDQTSAGSELGEGHPIGPKRSCLSIGCGTRADANVRSALSPLKPKPTKNVFLSSHSRSRHVLELSRSLQGVGRPETLSRPTRDSPLGRSRLAPLCQPVSKSLYAAYLQLNTLEIIGMSLLSVVIMFLSFAAGLFAIRELKILAEGDVERYQVVRAISLITMTIAPYFIPDP